MHFKLKKLALSPFIQAPSLVAVDTITTRFLLLFLFLLSIPLITVITFATSLFAGQLDKAADSQLMITQSLYHTALLDAENQLARPEPGPMAIALKQPNFQASSYCAQTDADLCIVAKPGINRLWLVQNHPVAFSKTMSVDAAQLEIPDISPVLSVKNRKTAPFLARYQKKLFLVTFNATPLAPDTISLRGIQIDTAMLDQIYERQPTLNTSIWLSLGKTTTIQDTPFLIASGRGLKHPIKIPDALLSFRHGLADKNDAPSYRLIEQELYNANHHLIGQIIFALPLAQHLNMLNNYYWGIYIISVASLIFSVLLAMLAGRTITQPLLKLISQANTLSRENLTTDQYEVPIAGILEIRQLGQAFNRMIKRLRQEHKMKDEFVATLTHDLKVPLLAEKQTLSYFRQEKFGSLCEEQAEILDIMLSSNQSCLSLVNGLLEVYRYESGEATLLLESVDMTQLLQESVGELKSLANQKNIVLTVEIACEETDYRVYADRLEIKRVLHNLISNAIINTQAHGSINCKLITLKHYGNDKVYKVSTFQYTTLKQPLDLNNGILVSIQDSGIGFSNEDLPFLFKQFAASKGRSPMSTGLGLYNCYQVIQAHQGFIWVESTEGEGSAVNFILYGNLQDHMPERRLQRDRRQK